MTDIRKQKMIEGMKLVKEVCWGACVCSGDCSKDDCLFYYHCMGEDEATAPWQWQDSFLSDTD